MGALASARLSFDGTFEEFNELALTRGWGDGLPLVPPSEEAVAAMLTATDLPAEHVVAIIPPLNGQATVEKIAVNAVMAGCRPEYLPVLIAVVECFNDPRYNLAGIQGTTNQVAPLTILHGPVVERLRFNCGYNLFGQGHRSNATVGRAVRLVILNVGGGTPGVMDRATLGQPGKYTFCIAENSPESPWEPLHVERGLPADASAVTLAAAAAPHNLLDSGSRSAEELLGMIARTVATMSNNIVFPCQALFVFGPEHAQLIAKEGWGKRQVKQFLWERARVAVRDFSPGMIEELSKRRAPWFHGRHVNDVKIAIAETPEDVTIVVAGGPGRHSMFLPSWGYLTRSITTRIRFKGDA
jgi:hypothetical protein